MSMGVKVFLGGCVLVCALGFHVVANPLLAASSLRSALADGDGNKVVEMIDFPALREDLKSDLDAALSKDDPMARALGGAMMTGVIDNMVQPKSVAKMVSAAASSSTKDKVQDNPLNDFSFRFGLRRFVLTVNTENGPVSVVFAPQALSWKIVGADADLKALAGSRF
jgi:hypothetical protein